MSAVATETARFRNDVVWNVAGLGVAGVCGIALNVLIGILYGSDALGVFNQVFAIFIVFGQIAVLGFQHSTVRAVAVNEGDARRAAAWSALILTLVVGSISSVLMWAIAPTIGSVLSSSAVTEGVRYAAPGLLAFALNKITLGILNGQRMMRWYAVLFSLRIVLMLLAFGVFFATGLDMARLPLILTVGETLTFLFSLVPCRPVFAAVRRELIVDFARKHFAFGARGFLSGIIAELNTRVDVLMLGVATSDAVVGIYSFAAIIAEGLFQLLVVVRTNYTPVCARLYAASEFAALEAVIKRGRRLTYSISLPAAAACILVYCYIGPMLPGGEIVRESGAVFAVIGAGIALSSGYLVFSSLLLSANRPGMHTWFMIAVVSFNVAANSVLIAWFGMIGAAFATALAFVFAGIAIRYLARRYLDVKL